MTLDLLLARRLLEAAADPYAPPRESDEAAGEMAELSARRGEGRSLRVNNYEGFHADDFSPMAWLLMLESPGADEVEPPHHILNALYNATEDEVIRLRLVSAVLGHPGTRARYAEALQKSPEPRSMEELPQSWPLRRIQALGEMAVAREGPGAATASAALEEFVLYLLQDGSPAARALAAVAVAPEEEWRRRAHDLARGIVRACDPELTDWGRTFRRARI